MPDSEIDNQSGVTTGELSRAVGLIRKDIADIKTAVPSKESVEHVRQEAKADNAGLRQRVADLENWQTWALRLGVPTMVVAALNAVNTYGSVVK